MGIEDDFVKQCAEQDRRLREIEDFCTWCLVGTAFCVALATLIFWWLV